MAFIPMLQFQGNCAAAMTRYAEIFEADDLSLLRYFEAPPEAKFPPSDLVMKAEMRVGESLLRGMDFPPPFPGEPQAAVNVTWHVSDFNEGKRLFDLLSKDGWSIVEYGPNHWASGFGLVRDTFGTHWMIVCGLKL